MIFEENESRFSSQSESNDQDQKICKLLELAIDIGAAKQTCCKASSTLINVNRLSGEGKELLLTRLKFSL
jgi:hypothetical protein